MDTEKPKKLPAAKSDKISVWEHTKTREDGSVKTSYSYMKKGKNGFVDFYIQTNDKTTIRDKVGAKLTTPEAVLKLVEGECLSIEVKGDQKKPFIGVLAAGAAHTNDNGKTQQEALSLMERRRMSDNQVFGYTLKKAVRDTETGEYVKINGEMTKAQFSFLNSIDEHQLTAQAVARVASTISNADVEKLMSAASPEQEKAEYINIGDDINVTTENGTPLIVWFSAKVDSNSTNLDYPCYMHAKLDRSQDQESEGQHRNDDNKVSETPQPSKDAEEVIEKTYSEETPSADAATKTEKQEEGVKEEEEMGFVY